MNPKAWTLAAAILGSSIVFLDSTLVTVALPRIGQELPRSVLGVLEGQSYVYNGYLLSLSSLLILAGALNDYYGRRRMFIVGLVGFGLTSMACGLAPSMEVLVLARLAQGAAGAILVPGSLSLITVTFTEPEEQGRAFGLWAGASAATTILGPFVGGLLVDGISWRMAFYINAPLVIAALWATLTHVRESRDETASAAFDWLGAAIVALAVGGLTFGPIYGQQREWREPIAFVALALGAVALAALPIVTLRSAHPLIPPQLFRSRNFTVTNLSTLVIYGALYVTSYYIALYQQGMLGYTASAAGLAGVPISLFLVFLSSRFGALAGRYGPRWFMAAGPAIMAAGVLWLARLSADSAPWTFRGDTPASYLPPTSYFVDFLPAFLLFGSGLCMLVAPLTSALMASVPAHNSGVASAINNAISRVGPQLAGSLIFVAITATFYASVGMAAASGADADLRGVVAPLNRPSAEVPTAVASAARAASADAFHLAMLVSAGLLLAGAAINALGIRNPTGSIVER